MNVPLKRELLELLTRACVEKSSRLTAKMWALMGSIHNIEAPNKLKATWKNTDSHMQTKYDADEKLLPVWNGASSPKHLTSILNAFIRWPGEKGINVNTMWL